MKNSVNKIETLYEFAKEAMLRFPIVLINTGGSPNLIVSHVASTVVTVVCLGLMPWMAPVLMENMSK